MKNKCFGLFLLISSVANAQTVKNLQKEIIERHGIEIIRPYGEHSDAYVIGDIGLEIFMGAFLVEAEKQRLSEGDRKRFFPVKMKIQVYPENWFPPGLGGRRTTPWVSDDGPDVGFHADGIKAGHESASATVSFIIKHFPLEGTNEALRGWATMQAIMDKIQHIKEQGVRIESCSFSTPSFIPSNCSISDVGRIAYETREKLLQGLINVAKAIEKGEEIRSAINITDVPWLKQDSNDQLWNKWLIDDESETENLILEYMERLRVAST